MERKTVEEIVCINDADDTPEEIVSVFIYKQEKFGMKLSNEQISNITALAKLLYFPNKIDHNIPVIANVPMGEGKSTLLVEFVRYMYDNDPDFGVIVVKKTLKECDKFCAEFGVMDPILSEYYFGNDLNGMKLAYDNYSKEKPDILDGVDVIGGQKGFVARVVRGFNFGDCKKYEAASKKWKFGEVPNKNIQYDYRLCNNCKIVCNARKSKMEQGLHQVLAITHTRLFYSNFDADFMDNILFFTRNKEKIKRKILIIDEKVDMCDVVRLNDKQFDNLKNIISANFPKYCELFVEIENYINSLEYANKINQPAINQTRFYRNGKGFSFDDELIDAFYKNPVIISKDDYEALIILQKILNSSNITTFIPLQQTNKENIKFRKELYSYEYIDLLAYSKNFEKTIILDATANLDYDYLKTNSILCDAIEMEKRQINLFIPERNANTSKSRLIQKGNQSLGIDNRCAVYQENLGNIVKECAIILQGERKKTLIVVYKEIGFEHYVFDFRDDFERKIKEYAECTNYTITHHGEYTTGVNHLSDNERVIFIGMLNKSDVFYQNKCLAVGRTLFEDWNSVRESSKTEINDYLITTIQQIGRTAYRNKKLIDVHLICKNTLAKTLSNELIKYFDIIGYRFENFYYYQEPAKQELLLQRIMILLKSQSARKGTTIKKAEIHLVCKELDMDKSILRKAEFQRKLKDIGLINNSKNNREYVYIGAE